MTIRVQVPDGRIVEFPDGTPQRVMAQALSRLPSAQSEPKFGPMDYARAYGNRALEGIPDALGAAGGTIGTVGGPAGRAAGAAVGGTVGEYLRQGGRILTGADKPPVTLGEAVGRVRGQFEAGANQAALQAGGEAVGVVAKAAGNGLMRSALRPTAKMLQRNPKLVENAVETGARVGLGGQAAARGRVAQSGRELAATLERARQQGWRLKADDLRPALDKYIRDNIEGQSAAWVDRANELRKAFDRFVSQNPGDLSPQALKLIKRGEQLNARAVYNKRAAELVAPDAMRAAQESAALASIIRQSLETIPGVAAIEGRTQKLLGVSEAIDRAGRLRPTLASHIIASVGAGAGGIHGGAARGIPEAVGGYALGHALTSPVTLSHVAWLLTRPAVQDIVRQSPRIADVLIRSAEDGGHAYDYPPENQ